MMITYDGHDYSIAECVGDKNIIMDADGGYVGQYQTALQSGDEYHYAETDSDGWVSIHENEIEQSEDVAVWALVQILTY